MESITVYPESATIYPESYNITPEFLRWYNDDMFPFLGPFVLMTIIIISLNGFTLFLFFLERKTVKIPEKYVISMTCGDFITGLANISVGLQTFWIPGLRDHRICYALESLAYAKFLIAVNNLLITTIDRFHCTVFPHHYRMKVTPKIANIIIISSWMIGLIIGLAGYGADVDTRGYYFKCSKNFVYVTFVTMIYTPICLLTTIILYVVLHRKLNATVFKTQSSVWMQIIRLIWKKEKLSVSNDTNMKELRLTLLLIVTATVALFSFIPPVITYMVFVLDNESSSPQIILLIFLFCPPLHSVIHPLLYALNLKKIRRRAVGIFNKMYCYPDIQPEKKQNQSSSNAFTGSTIIKFSYHKPGTTFI